MAVTAEIPDISQHSADNLEPREDVLREHIEKFEANDGSWTAFHYDYTPAGDLRPLTDEELATKYQPMYRLPEQAADLIALGIGNVLYVEFL